MTSLHMLAVLGALVLSSTSLCSQDIFGKWKTIDDNTGNPRSILEIYEHEGKAYGRVLEIFPKPGKSGNPICTECDGPDKDMPVIGMDIIKDMEQDGDEWSSGTIVDPENGKRYDCKIWYKGEKLMVRGYVAFFYRTQEWLPYKD